MEGVERKHSPSDHAVRRRAAFVFWAMILTDADGPEAERMVDEYERRRGERVMT